ncbi:hypothetical protein [Streptomyces sp. NPDC002553]|uniref:endonuclease/exonuclease/phosphatase family protein n=1 Tax=Streptomyces sp. NPDC002553 TaxID=3154417 RepID=UPI0033276C68
MNLEHDGGPDVGGGPPRAWHQAQELINSRRPDLLLRQEMTYSRDSHHRRLHAAERALGMHGFLGTTGLGRNRTGLFVREVTFEVHQHVTHQVHPWRTPPTHTVLRLRDAPEVDIITVSWHLAFNSPRGREREADEILAFATRSTRERPSSEAATATRPPTRRGRANRRSTGTRSPTACTWPTAAPGPRPESARSAPTVRSERTWQHDPLLSTLRDVGGCVAVIAMGVLITALVSAVHAVWPPTTGTIPHPGIVHHTPEDQR